MEVFSVFLRLGLTSFGGPVAHIAYFRKELVEKRQWVSDSHFSQLLAICQFLPGPASSQLGFCLGLTRGGALGALAAFVAFTLPSALLLLLFAQLLPSLSAPIGQALLHGLKIVAFAVVADALVGMSKNLCPDKLRAAIAIIAAGVLLLSNSSWMQVFVVAAAAVAGFAFCRTGTEDKPADLQLGYGHKSAMLLLLLFFLLLLGLPMLAANTAGVLMLADVFYRAGALVFGGGHVVLPLLQDAVVGKGMLPAEQFLAGYGAAQAIPGPLFTFSAYLGALIPTGQPVWVGAGTALLFMFVPGFLLVAGILPFWHSFSRNAAAHNAIAGVNAAVVGLLGAALYDPIFTSAIIDAVDMALALVAFALLSVFRLSALWVVLWCSSTSIVVALL